MSDISVVDATDKKPVKEQVRRIMDEEDRYFID